MKKQTIARVVLSRGFFFTLIALGPAATLGLNVLDLLPGVTSSTALLSGIFYAMLGIWVAVMLTVLLCLVCTPVGTHAAKLMNRRAMFLAAASTTQ